MTLLEIRKCLPLTVSHMTSWVPLPDYRQSLAGVNSVQDTITVPFCAPECCSQKKDVAQDAEQEAPVEERGEPATAQRHSN